MTTNSYDLQNLLPFAAMTAAQCLLTGLRVINKAAMSRGMSNFVFIVYANALGTLLLSLAHFFSQRINRPPITFRMLGKLFILGFFDQANDSKSAGLLWCNFAFAGLNYSSPTLSSAMSNMEPALTFLLAVIFRMEKVNIRCFRSQIKISGTLVSVLGALTITLYKGPAVWTSPQSNTLTGSTLSPSWEPLNIIPSISNWVIGGSCFAVSALSVSVSNILQASVLKQYPSEITVILFYSQFGTLQCAVISLIAESDLNAWKLRPGIELVSVLYTAVGGTVLHSRILAWCLVKKGPVFVAMFCPLGAVIAAVMSVIFLGDTLHIGSVVGAIIIVSGFYAVIWAKSQDKEKDEQGTDQSSSSSQTIPLLLDH